MPAPVDDAVGYYSQAAPEFHASYEHDANRVERMRVWTGFLDRYAPGVDFAYDIGCGSGILACELARRGIETRGVDGAAGMLTIAQRSAQAASLRNVSFEQHRLPVPDTQAWRRAELVVSSSAIEYLDSIADALAFLRNLLEEGGVTIFSVSNRDSLSRRLVRTVHRLTGRPRYLKFLRHFMTVDELRSALRAAGLSYLEHAYFGRADRINRSLSHVVPPRYASNMIIMAARRETDPSR
ncbi:MAG TPA: class I SAM-dependent methyltransferase [Steroidobacteraceae bacterium]|nr:class I SAM-dependent methyltransferase [Steroidobacteraceae bacterium]